MSRCQLTDSLMDCVVKISDGNPGAVTVLAKLYKECPTIDPDAAMGGFIHILALDDMEIYGSNIWILYKDVCEENIVNFITLLRAKQLGIITKDKLVELSKDNPQTYPKQHYDYLHEMYTKVCLELPNFNKMQ